MVRALLFDFDGVVVDTEAAIYESWREIYREHGVDLELTAWLPAVGSGSSTLPGGAFDAVSHLEGLIGKAVDRETVLERRTRRRSELCDRARLLPGVAEYLTDARALVLKTGIVTRASESWVEHHLARVDLTHAWDAIVCGNGAPGTPKSTFYREALDRLGVANEAAVAFEDSPHGVRAAKEAGIRCVAVPNEVTRGAAFEEADVVLGSLAEQRLADLIARLAAQSR